MSQEAPYVRPDSAADVISAAPEPEAVEHGAGAESATAENSQELSVSVNAESQTKKEDPGKFAATMTGTMPSLSGEDPKAEADRLLQYGERIQQQMDFFGDGHPQSGQLAVSYAHACNIVARATLSKGMFRTSKKLLDRAMHFLRLHHSVIVFGEHNRALAETYSNLGCLQCKREKLSSSLAYFRKAIEIEGGMEWEDSHASTLISACSTLSLLHRHGEAAELAKLAVDMLAQSPDLYNSETSSELGDGVGAADLLPIALNNLGLEMLYLHNHKLAAEAYEKGLELAAARWGEEDERTQSIGGALEEMRRGVPLGRYGASASVGAGALRRVERAQVPRYRLLRPPKSKSGLGLYTPKPLRVAPLYSERISPVERAEDKTAGFHSPRFWATKDGMQPRRVSPFNKDTRQIGLEMARRGGAAQFPSYVVKARWGEQRVQWGDLPDADLSRIDGSVHSRSRLFSTAVSNEQLNAVARIHDSRLSIRSRYPTSLGVYQQAQALRNSYLGEQSEDGPGHGLEHLGGADEEEVDEDGDADSQVMSLLHD